MMKSKKIMIVFILVIALLLLTATCTKASDDISELPTIVTNSENEQGSNNEQNNEANVDNNAVNNELATVNNETSNDETLPQTGVQENATLFIFIAICIASAVYAYFRIKKYNDVH